MRKPQNDLEKEIETRIWASLILLSLLLFFTLISCAPRMSAILSEGKVIERDGERYLVIWKDVADKPYSYAYNWVYKPGMGLVPVEDLEVYIVIKPKNP